jgi:hypothetical protein
MAFHFPFTTLVATQKNCPDLGIAGLSGSGEIIYKSGVTPAVGVNFMKRRTRE